MEYDSSREEIKCNRDEVSEEYMWSNAYHFVANGNWEP